MSTDQPLRSRTSTSVKFCAQVSLSLCFYSNFSAAVKLEQRRLKTQPSGSDHSGLTCPNHTHLSDSTTIKCYRHKQHLPVARYHVPHHRPRPHRGLGLRLRGAPRGGKPLPQALILDHVPMRNPHSSNQAQREQFILPYSTHEESNLQTSASLACSLFPLCVLLSLGRPRRRASSRSTAGPRTSRPLRTASRAASPPWPTLTRSASPTAPLWAR